MRIYRIKDPQTGAYSVFNQAGKRLLDCDVIAANSDMRQLNPNTAPVRVHTLTFKATVGPHNPTWTVTLDDAQLFDLPATLPTMLPKGIECAGTQTELLHALDCISEKKVETQDRPQWSDATGTYSNGLRVASADIRIVGESATAFRLRVAGEQNKYVDVPKGELFALGADWMHRLGADVKIEAPLPFIIALQGHWKGTTPAEKELLAGVDKYDADAVAKAEGLAAHAAILRRKRDQLV